MSSNAPFRRLPRGFTMMEMIVALAILGSVFVGIMLFMNVIVNSLYSESIESDQQTRGSGRMYDILSEIRQATAQSPNFAVAGGVSVPPSITFDLPSTTSSAGAMVWGSKVTYKLVANTGNFIDAARTVPDAMIVRDEVPTAGAATITTTIEQHVPYQITEKGVVYWGFNVSITGTAVTVSIRRSGDTNVNLGTTVQATGSTQGTLATAIFTGTYYLRNSQVTVPTAQ